MYFLRGKLDFVNCVWRISVLFACSLHDQILLFTDWGFFHVILFSTMLCHVIMFALVQSAKVNTSQLLQHKLLTKKLNHVSIYVDCASQIGIVGENVWFYFNERYVVMRERMSFIGQVSLCIQGMCYIVTVQQDKMQIIKIHNALINQCYRRCNWP